MQCSPIDLVETEDGSSIGAYVYDAAENCLVLVFDKPEPFDTEHVRAVLLKSAWWHCDQQYR